MNSIRFFFPISSISESKIAKIQLERQISELLDIFMKNKLMVLFITFEHVLFSTCSISALYAILKMLIRRGRECGDKNPIDPFFCM